MKTFHVTGRITVFGTRLISAKDEGDAKLAFKQVIRGELMGASGYTPQGFAITRVKVANTGTIIKHDASAPVKSRGRKARRDPRVTSDGKAVA